MNQTTAPIIAGQTADAEFMDAKAVFAHFGLKVGMLTNLDADGLIRSVSLRRPGRVRGKRLYVVQSIRDYLNSLES